MCECACVRACVHERMSTCLCKHTCFSVQELAMSCLNEAVKRGSEMRERQFEVGNEQCPSPFERQRPRPLQRHLLHVGTCAALQHAVHSRRRGTTEGIKRRSTTTASRSDLRMKYQPGKRRNEDEIGIWVGGGRGKEIREGGEVVCWEV